MGRRAALQRRGRGDRLCRLPRRDARGADRARIARCGRSRRSASSRCRSCSISSSRSAPTGTWPKSAALATAGLVTSFPAQVFVGRALVLFFMTEVGLAIAVADRRRSAARERSKLHALMLAIAAFGALTPLLANFAQSRRRAGRRRSSSARCSPRSRRRVCGASSISPPAWRSTRSRGGRRASPRVHGHWRAGFVKGAIYGGVFMLLVLAVSAPSARSAAWWPSRSRHARVVAPIAGALAFPFAQTLIGSADGTPPFFGRLRRGLSRPARAGARHRRRRRRAPGPMSVDLAARRAGPSRFC